MPSPVFSSIVVHGVKSYKCSRCNSKNGTDTKYPVMKVVYEDEKMNIKLYCHLCVNDCGCVKK